MYIMINTNLQCHYLQRCFRTLPREACADGETIVDACSLGDDFAENDDEGGREDDSGPSSAEDTVKYNRKRFIYNHVAIRAISQVGQEDDRKVF